MNTYTVNIGGVDHTLQLSDEDAKARGLTAEKPETKAALAKSNKAASAKNKSA